MPKTDQGDPELRRLGKRLARIEASLAGLEAMLRAHLTPGQASVGASAARRSDETKAAWNADIGRSFGPDDPHPPAGSMTSPSPSM